MSRINIYASVAALAELFTLASAHGSPSCLRDKTAYELKGDSIEWSMAIAPGANCIQGLRWSYMQIYAVWVLKAPSNGEIVMVGPGFRYFAKSDFSGTDKFTLVVVGKNRHEEGYSTVEIVVSPSNSPPTPRMARVDSEVVSKVADATPPTTK